MRETTIGSWFLTEFIFLDRVTTQHSLQNLAPRILEGQPTMAAPGTSVGTPNQEEDNCNNLSTAFDTTIESTNQLHTECLLREWTCRPAKSRHTGPALVKGLPLTTEVVCFTYLFCFYSSLGISGKVSLYVFMLMGFKSACKARGASYAARVVLH